MKKNRNNQTKKWGIRLGILALSLLLLTACGRGKGGRIIDGVLEEKFNDFTLTEEYVARDNLDYDSIFVDEQQSKASDPRYADSTPDGKMDWTKKYEGAENPQTKEFLNHVTLNGKPVSFPTSFAGLGEEFAAFDKIDLKNLKKENLDLVFINKEYDNMLRFFKMPFEGSHNHLVDVLKDNVGLISIRFNDKDHQVTGLSSNIENFPDSYDLRVKGTGIGNTFNEMYAAFGEPTYVFYFEDRGQTNIRYKFQGERYYLSFQSQQEISNPFEENMSPVYNHVITSITVDVEEE